MRKFWQISRTTIIFQIIISAKMRVLSVLLLASVVTVTLGRGSCGLSCYRWQKCMGGLDGGSNRPGQLGDNNNPPNGVIASSRPPTPPVISESIALKGDDSAKVDAVFHLLPLPITLLLIPLILWRAERFSSTDVRHLH